MSDFPKTPMYPGEVSQQWVTCSTICRHDLTDSVGHACTTRECRTDLQNLMSRTVRNWLEE